MTGFFQRRPVVFAGRVLQLYLGSGGGEAAAALAYFLVLSVFPLLLCVSFVIGVFHLDLQHLLLELEHILPAQALELMEQYLEVAATNQSPALLTAALTTILISGSAALRTLFHAMQRLYDHPAHGPWVQLGLSVLLSLGFLGTVYCSVAVVFTGDWLIELLRPYVLGAGLLWQWVRYLILFCVVLVAVLGIYTAGTPKDLASKKSVRLGSLFTAGAIVLGCVIFSRMIGFSTRYSLVYGSLASLMILLVWLYFCCNILVLGAVCIRVVGLEKRA